MPQFLNILKRSLVITVATVALALAPATVTFADDPPVCTPPSQTDPGVHEPTGAEASMFTYQCDGPYAGLWTSAHFVFNPADNSKSPLFDLVYTYNDATGQWDYDWWDFSAAKGDYHLITLSVVTPPIGAKTVGGPKPAIATPTGPSGASQTSPTTSTDGSGVTLNGNNNTSVNDTTNATMNNGIISFAGTGNATVSGNTIGGSATSGNAVTVADVINMLQSSSNVLGSPNVTTFTADINGDVNGDLLLDPTKLNTVQPANVSTSLDNHTLVNNTVNAAMNNDINLNSQTGNATVSGNSQAGDATTGNANAVANIVNVLNSYVTAGQSFVGVININGNLNGDILLPPDFVDTLLANNVPHYNITTNLTNQNTITNVNNATVQNNVTLGATSGNATVAGNSRAGNATTGNALTNLTVFNLTGSNVVASNDLLVFVNVLGQWYGMILNAPAGTTAASLGGGVVDASVNNDATLNNTNNQNITNNVNVNSRTGDASVTHNTLAGNAKSGEATASANIMNLINDRLTLNGWFGLLFINVFGTWHGSFGVNTSAGDPAAAPQSSGDSGQSPMFAFFPHGTATGGAGAGNSSFTEATGAALDGQTGVLAAATHKAATELPQLAKGGTANYALPLLGAGVAIILVAIGERGGRLLNRRS